MDKDLIVAIFAPVNEDEGEIGTGYPIGEDLILTSRHVIKPEGRDEKYPLRIRWHYYSTEGQSIKPEDVVWCGAGEVDAALIRCPLPEQTRGRMWGIIADKKPPFHQAWQSSGFPRAARYNGEREPAEFSGTAESMADNANYFSINVASAPKATEDWSGASGMPVFIQGEILGVVCSVPPQFESRLHVVPTWKMFQDEKFQEVLGLDKRREHLASTRKTIERMLRTADGESLGTKSMTQRFADRLGIRIFIGQDGSSREVVANKLLGITIESLFDTVGGIRKELSEHNNEAGVVFCAKIIQYVLPVLFNHKVVDYLRRHKADETVALTQLPASLRTVAEIIMAGVDQRPTRFRPKAPNEDWPEGEARLQQLPEGGRAGTQSKKDFRTQLCNLLEPETQSKFVQEFEDYLRQKFIGTDMRSQLGEDKIDGYINNELEYQAQHNNLTYYLLVPAADASLGNEKQRVVIEELKKRYRHIVFITLNKDGLLREQRIYRPLRDLIS